MKKQAGKWPLRKIVEVEFMDACTNGGWTSPERQRRESHPSVCRAVGYLLESTPRHVTVAQNISSDSGNVADTISIPRAAITRVRTIALRARTT